MNKELLETVPHKLFLDLAVTYSYLCKEDEEGVESISIINSYIETLGCSLKEIYEISVANTTRLFPIQIRSISEVLCEVMGGYGELMKL